MTIRIAPGTYDFSVRPGNECRGPNADRIFDALRYRHTNGVQIPVEMTGWLIQPGQYREDEELVTLDISVKMIGYKSGQDGALFLVVEFAGFTGETSGYYDAAGRAGLFKGLRAESMITLE